MGIDEMSFYQTTEPVCRGCDETSIETLIEARCRSIGDFSVGRVLPSVARRTVGPFIFFDHMGPADLAPGQGIQVRPHPHINLATVTYLFEGEIEHRDSLGYYQTIKPGAVNWMTAGRGIVHSERSSVEEVARQSRLDGIQLWVGLPKADEETEPSFAHHPANTIPEMRIGGATARVLIGTAWEETSPVQTVHPMFYAAIEMPRGSEVTLPGTHPERAAYLASGEVQVGLETLSPKQMAVFRRDSDVILHATSDSRVMVIGGEPLDGPRHLWWNFVSSSKERIERAKTDWVEGHFPKVAGDESEFIPLPD
jgi:redox-sensitive bicupin YhaK (pirin superfamily)